MQRLKMTYCDLTLYEGCEMYVDNCRQRNLRVATINHYRQSYNQLFKCFSPDMCLTDFTQNQYNTYVCYLKERLTNDISINAYLRDLITTLHFLMKNEYMPKFDMQCIKVDKSQVETYTDEELSKLLMKPNISKCTYIDYQSYVMTNFLFSTGVRQHSLMNIKIRDVDLYNNIVYVNVTKNRKPLIVPINQTMVSIIKEFLKYRQFKNGSDYLFCNVYGKQLVKSTCYHQLYEYNKRRGVETTGIHRYRHTFAKQWILNGGNVVTLQKILGHSSLAITQNYINLLVSDAIKEANQINLIDKFTGNTKTRIRLTKK